MTYTITIDEARRFLEEAILLIAASSGKGANKYLRKTGNDFVVESYGVSRRFDTLIEAVDQYNSVT